MQSNDNGGKSRARRRLHSVIGESKQNVNNTGQRAGTADIIQRMRVLFTVLFTGLAFAQQPAPEPAKPKRMPEPKNLQVLKMAPAELIPLMRSYNTALGVQCVFCHVQGDFASDEKGHKLIARRMITMTQDVNKQVAEIIEKSGQDAAAGAGEMKATVTCYTCHRGDEHPKVSAPAAPNGAPATPNAPPTPPPPPAP